MSFGIYIAGYLILILGSAIGSNMLNLPPKWIGVGIICLVGMAIVHGVTVTRQKDTSSQVVGQVGSVYRIGGHIDVPKHTSATQSQSPLKLLGLSLQTWKQQ